MLLSAATLCAQQNAAPDAGSADPPAKAPDISRTPIVMERSTARGRVVLLEDRNSDRDTVAGILIEIWSVTDQDDPNPVRKKDKLLHKTQTNDRGMFDLPELDEAIYVLVVGRLHLGLRVLPRTVQVKEGETAAPKALIILVPKDVV